MQEGYEHCLPETRNKENQTKRRIAIIFRHGKEKHIAADNGVACSKLEKQPKSPLIYDFGPMKDKLVEGQLYARIELLHKHAHR